MTARFAALLAVALTVLSGAGAQAQIQLTPGAAPPPSRQAAPAPTVKGAPANPSPSSQKEQGFTRDYTIGLFDDAVLFTASASDEMQLVRWSGPVRVFVFGDARNQVTPTVEALAAEIKGLTRLDLQYSDKSVNLALVVSNDIVADITGRYGAAIKTLYSSEQAYNRAVERQRTGSSACFNAAGITDGKFRGVFVAADAKAGPSGVRQCLLQNFVAGFGIFGYPEIRAESVFNRPPTDFAAPTVTLREVDRYLLSLIYRPELSPGMTRTQVVNVLNQIIDADGRLRR